MAQTADRWTDEQRLVLTERGNSLLVSAAAGSGKTAVLVERIIRLITEGEAPPDIDRLLVLTFTNAAAAQMRERIRSALEKALEEDPGNAHLQKQMTLVHNAQITTIDSFCLEVVRAHCVLQQREGTGGMPALPEPGFRIADEGEIALLKQEILEQVLEQVVSEEQYRPFVKAYASRRDDRNLGEMIRKFYDYSESDPWPARWRRQAAQAYHMDSGEELFRAGWTEKLTLQTCRLARGILERLVQLAEMTDLPGGPAGYRGAIEKDIQRFEYFLQWADARTDTGAGAYDAFRNAVMEAGQWGGIGRISKKEPVDEALKDLVKNGRDSLKKEWTEAGRRYFLDADRTIQVMEGCYEAVTGLADAADLFEDLFALEKRERGIVDFSDLEHFAMQVLTEGEGEDCRPSGAAREYARRFLYVMTDEYQDSNLVQEYILRAVCGGDRGLHNRFMVGDVKQSIYRFRLARPELFLEKYASYRQILPESQTVQDKDMPGSAANGITDESGNTDGRGAEETGEDLKIELHRNFRSRRRILEGVNMIFRQIMAPDVGDVAYDEDAALVPGAAFPEDEDKERYMPELHIIAEEPDAGQDADVSGEEDAEETDEDLLSAELDKQEKEAVLAGNRIRQLVGTFPVQDEQTGELRPARYSDIAVLLRSSEGWMDSFSSVFTAMDIPCYAGAGGGFFDTMEVRTVLAALEIIDDPFQDIPLAGVLRSPVGGFSDEELSRIRIRFRACEFYTACRQYARLGQEDSGQACGEAGQEKDVRQAGPENSQQRPLSAEENMLAQRLHNFLADLDMLREESALTPVHVLIRRLLDHTGYENVVLAMPGGEQRRANLEMLIEKAVAFEKGNSTGLFRFLQYMRSLKESGTGSAEAPVLGENDEAVRIMTIHKSKGLEFPIVFLCGLGKQFNRMDLRSELMMHPDLGIGVRCFRDGRRTVQEPLLREVIRDELLLESQGEEFRVLYVAMTRAREKLILTGMASRFEKRLRTWDSTARTASPALPFWHRRKANGYLDLIMPAVLRHACADGLAREYGLRRPEQAQSSAAYHDGEGFVIRIVPGDQITAVPVEGTVAVDAGSHLFDTDPLTVYDEELHRHLEEAGRLREEARSRIRRLSGIPGTLTVSQLKEEPGEEELDQSAFRFDAGGQPRGRLRGAERGTLYHDILEFLDYSLLPGPGEALSQEAFQTCLKTVLESMRDCGKIQNDILWKSGPDLDRLLADLVCFLESPTGKDMRRAALRGELHRETSFLLGMSADRIDPEWDADRMVQVQGRIDAWFTQDGKAAIIDYKTDRVPDGMEAEEFFSLHRHYDRQLEIYREALERLTDYKVSRMILYSFDRGQAVSLSTDSEQYS